MVAADAWLSEDALEGRSTPLAIDIVKYSIPYQFSEVNMEGRWQPAARPKIILFILL